MDANSEKPKLPRAVFDKALTFVLAGFGFVAALAWNDAIQSFFNEVFGTTGQSSLLAKFGYAILITVVVTVISLRLGKDVGPKP